MAANKFATMVYNNTNKITLVLIYAVLEWTLIILLLLNSIFSYFIIKFARFFGLKPPCIWCTHLNQFFEPNNKNSCRDLLCELHSKEISQLGFCSKHQKLAESDNMCEDCSSKKLVLDFVQSDENTEVCLKCSCCGVDFIDQSGSGLVDDNFGEKDEVEKQEKETEEIQDLEFLLDYSGNKLVSVESIDPTVDEDLEFGDFQKAQVVSESKIETVTEEILKVNQETDFVLEIAARELYSVTEKTEDSSKFSQLDSMEFEETENSLVFHVNLNGYPDENHSIPDPTRTQSDAKELQETGVQETERSDSDNEEAEVSIGTEIPVLDPCDEMKAQNNFNLYSTSSHDLDFNLENGIEEPQEDEKTEELMIERKESMVDESFDGLKSALRAERKALQALYIELEEERSASAVAASETMAMINRLQEEKAAMQMEALHYQRMMEEQSEYDQEALQLLNEIMVKKDKELELYRTKVLDYEAKERMRFSTSSVKSGTCSASCSHSEDGEGIANGNQESPSQDTFVDPTLNLDSLFIDIEDERLSILEQLKVLEEKLVTLSDEEDHHFGDLGQIEDYYEENYIYYEKVNDNGQEVNGITNGFPLEHEIHYQDQKAIRSTESDAGVVMTTPNGNGNGFHSHKVENAAITRFELQKRRIDIEEEVEQLYVRLQAIEADIDFLKHCIGSLKKGDKGMKLVQEILQHLRDLRNIDLRAKIFTDGTLV